MRWSVLNTPLGLTDTFQNRKMAGADLASLGFGVIGMALDWDAQTQANAINRQNAIETNKLNREINEQQLAWAREKYREEKAENRFLVNQAYQRELENRAYNSPQAQKLRYLQAGINPYLAMYGGGSSGGVSSIGTTVGSPPKYDNTSMIPMQQGSPAVAYTGFGQGISNIVDSYYRGRDSERADYALASDITFRDAQNRQKDRELLLKEKDQLLEEKKYGLSEREFEKQREFIDKQIDHLDRSDLLDKNRYEHQKQYDDAQQRIDKYRAETERINAHTNRILANSQIELNQTSQEELQSRVRVANTQVQEMIANGRSKRQIEAYIGQQEEIIVKQLIDEYRKTHSQAEFDKNAPVMLKKFRQVANNVLEPLRGVIGASVNAGVSAAKKVP